MKIYGIAGWKNCGKTSLVERLVADFVARGLRVATVKHAHHQADVDHPGTDSFRHRAAGASQTILATPSRWALMHEMAPSEEAPLEALIARLDPCDLVLVEGFKRAPHPKIEVFRPAACSAAPIALSNTTVRAVATDGALPDLSVPVLDLNATQVIADFIWNDTP